MPLHFLVITINNSGICCSQIYVTVYVGGFKNYFLLCFITCFRTEMRKVSLSLYHKV